MKPLHTLLIAGTALSMYLAGCSTPQGTREDYFGYNNKPVVEEEKETPREQVETPPPAKTWHNPLSDNYPTVVYVPVNAPWWDRYYGWDNYHRNRVMVMYPHHHGYPYGWDYAYGYPYYDYHYGHRYGRRHYDYPSYPVATVEEPEKKKTTRRVGSSRGSVNEESSKDSRGSDNSGWKVRGRGETSTGSGGTGELVTTPEKSSSSRSTKVVSRGGPETKKEESKSEVKSTSTQTSKKPDSGSDSKKSSTTEKREKATVRGRGQ